MSFDSLLPSNTRRGQAGCPTHESINLAAQNREYSFVVASQHKGVVPEILETLLQERKDVKVLLRQATSNGDRAMMVIYDLRQKAIKVAANAFCERSQNDCALCLAPSCSRAAGTLDLQMASWERPAPGFAACQLRSVHWRSGERCC